MGRNGHERFLRAQHLPYPNIVDVPVTGYPGAGNNPNQHIGDPQDPDIEVTMDIQVAAASYSLATGRRLTSGSTGAARNPAASRTPCGKRRPRAATCARSPGGRRARWQCGARRSTTTLWRWRTGQRTLWRRAPDRFRGVGRQRFQGRRRRSGQRRCAVVVPERRGLRRHHQDKSHGGRLERHARSLRWRRDRRRFFAIFSAPRLADLGAADSLNDNDATHRMVPDVAANADPIRI